MSFKPSKLYDELVKPNRLKEQYGSYNYPIQPFQRQQADLLFLPTDPTGNKYLLVFADIGTRLIDAEPIKNKKASTVKDAYKKILKRGILQSPTLLTVDEGTEFKGDFKKFVESEAIILNFAMVGRKQQMAIVERANQSLGKYLNMVMTDKELTTRKRNREWVQYVRPLIKQLNKKRKRKPKSKNLLEQFEELKPVKCPKSGCKLLEVNTPVRVKLEYPIDPITGQKLSEKFRVGDIRYSPQVYNIDGVRLFSDKPPFYYIRELNTLYTRDELKPTTTKREKDEFYPLRIRGEKGSKYIIEWKDYPNKKDWTPEPKKYIEKEFPNLVNNWIEFQKSK